MANVQHFDNLSHFADHLSALENSGRASRTAAAADSYSFYGGTFKDALHRARWGGDEKTTRKIEKLVNEIELDLPSAEVRGCVSPAVVGFLPHVQNHLAGLPDAMMTYAEERSERAPLRIGVDVCCSGGVEAADMVRRGSAIAAFAYLASTQRPVELFAVAGMNTQTSQKTAQIPVIRLGASPLDISAVTFALTDPAMLRRLCFTFAEHAGRLGSSSIRWGWNSRPTNKDYLDGMHAALGFDATNPSDIFLHGGYYGDNVFGNPVAWVQDMLAKHCQQYED